MIISVTIHGMLMKKGLWNAETDENGNGLNVDELELPEKLPSFGVSLLPIIIPIVLILLNTIVGAVGSTPAWLTFLGQKTTSMLCGTLVAMIIAMKTMGLKKAEASAANALHSAGMVFLITGAGGSFSAVITAAGVTLTMTGPIVKGGISAGGIAGTATNATFTGDSVAWGVTSPVAAGSTSQANAGGFIGHYILEGTTDSTMED